MTASRASRPLGASRRSLHAATVAAVVGLLPQMARAQYLLDQYIAAEIPGVALTPGVTVQSRARPEYDSLGYRVGEITIRPEVLESVGFDDNVLGTTSHRASALIETSAQVRASYDHSDTSAFTTVTVDNSRFPEQNQQSYTNWTAALGGSHQFGRDSLTVSYGHLGLNQTVRDLGVPQLDQALAYRVDMVRLDYRAVFNRVFLQPALTVSNYDYDNGTVAGQSYLQTYRNRVVLQPSMTLGYELAPQRNVIVVVRDAVAKYSNRIAGTSIRDFNDISVLTGVDFDSGGIWRYRALLGYEYREFSSASTKTIQGPVLEVEAIWNPTGLTTLTGNASRHVQDSADETTTGLTETALGFQIDHELQRDILLRGSTTYILDDYSQNQGTQSQISAGVGATWLLNRNMRVVGSYDFSRRVSTGSGNLGVITGQHFGSGYSEDRLLVQLRLAL